MMRAQGEKTRNGSKGEKKPGGDGGAGAPHQQRGQIEQ